MTTSYGWKPEVIIAPSGWPPKMPTDPRMRFRMTPRRKGVLAIGDRTTHEVWVFASMRERLTWVTAQSRTGLLNKFYGYLG